MQAVSSFRAVNLSISNYRTYLFAMLFIAGNVLLPQLCHSIPDGGKILLPIYFFTLIASYKFGIKVGLLTALLSPLCNYFLFGMPSAGMLPVLLVKSSLLAVAASWIALKSQKLSVWHIVLVVLIYQIVGGIAEWVISGSLSAALQDFRLGVPGMLLQVAGGWLVLKLMAKYEI